MPSIGHISYFYPRSPCGERLDVNNPVAALTSISIHALLAESDCYSLRHSAQGRYFYPRSPCGERPGQFRRCTRSTDISIHALLAESDGIFPASSGHYPNFYPRSPCGERLYHSTAPAPYTPNFYPRSPCGERRYSFAACSCFLIFLSTLSLRRATDSSMKPQPEEGISIHALLAESDPDDTDNAAREEEFLSTLSLRRATASLLRILSFLAFLSTLSLRRATD